MLMTEILLPRCFAQTCDELAVCKLQIATAVRNDSCCGVVGEPRQGDTVGEIGLSLPYFSLTGLMRCGADTSVNKQTAV